MSSFIPKLEFVTRRDVSNVFVVWGANIFIICYAVWHLACIAFLGTGAFLGAGIVLGVFWYPETTATKLAPFAKALAAAMN